MLQVLVWDHPMSKIISLNQLKQQACQPKMMPNKFVKIHGRMDLEAHSHSVRYAINLVYHWIFFWSIHHLYSVDPLTIGCLMSSHFFSPDFKWANEGQRQKRMGFAVFEVDASFSQTLFLGMHPNSTIILLVKHHTSIYIYTYNHNIYIYTHTPSCKLTYCRCGKPMKTHHFQIIFRGQETTCFPNLC